jgi:phosphatidylglycerophosphate synthase
MAPRSSKKGHNVNSSTVVGSINLRTFWARRNEVFSHPWTMAVNEPLGAILAYAAYLVHLSPNQVTILSLLASTLGAAAYYYLPGTYSASLVLLLLFQVAYGLDCADGQLARRTNTCSSFGKWLDIAVDFAGTLTIPFAMGAYGAAHSRGQLVACYFVGGLALAYAQVVLLFTYSMKRIAGIPGATRVSLARKVYRFANDTGFFLFLIVAVRGSAVAILAVLFTYAIMQLYTAIYVAYKMEASK